MTTIAWDATTIAWDSQMTSGTDIRTFDNPNKVRVVDDKVFALAGKDQYFDFLLNWYKNGADPDEALTDEQFAFVVFEPDEVKIFVGGFPMRRPYEQYAIGTGGDIALAVMRAGHDPVKAVEIAISMDIYSGGPINSLKFADVINVKKDRGGRKIVALHKSKETPSE